MASEWSIPRQYRESAVQLLERLKQEPNWAAANKKPLGLRKFENAEELWNKALEYFDYCAENPIKVPKLSYGTKMMVDYPRQYSKSGLFTYLSIDPRGSTWSQWKNPDAQIYRPDLVPVMDMCDTIIRDQKMEYGLVDVFNPMLVARDLGLTDKIQQDTTANVTTTNETTLTSTETDKYLAVHVHPLDPDPLDLPRPLFSRAQLDSGMPFIPPTPTPTPTPTQEPQDQQN